jgi:hypothetical protein
VDSLKFMSLDLIMASDSRLVSALSVARELKQAYADDQEQFVIDVQLLRIRDGIPPIVAKLFGYGHTADHLVRAEFLDLNIVPIARALGEGEKRSFNARQRKCGRTPITACLCNGADRSATRSTQWYHGIHATHTSQAN